MATILKIAGAPLRRYFNPKFEALSKQLEGLSERLGAQGTEALEQERATRARWLERVDVSDHNRDGRPPAFTVMESHAVSAAQCVEPGYLNWYRLLQPGWLEDAAAHTHGGDQWLLSGGFTGAPVAMFNRKTWEWAFIAEAGSQFVRTVPGGRAIGFGVGNEPLPALLASWGMEVVATDQAPDSVTDWAETGELLQGLAGLSRPHLLSDDDLARRVTTMAVDMNQIPGDLGSFDFVWSSCAMEHLGSPRRGLEFVENSCRLLRRGGIAVHTTELELTSKEATADYGHCAVYRPQDVRDFTAHMVAQGYESSINTYIAMDTPQDRWMCMGAIAGQLTDIAHLRVVLGDSVSTSFGVLIRRPLEHCATSD